MVDCSTTSTTMLKYDVFISYRRDKGAETARLLRMALTQRGYRVFLDVDDLSSGHFDDSLLQDIEQAAHFIVILSPGALERADDPRDWVRRELEHAIATGRNIIPIMMPGFEFPDSDALPSSLHSLQRHNGVKYSHEYFDAAVIRLAQYMPQPSASPGSPRPTANNETATAPASADSYGAFVREPATPYIVFGLLTAWAYLVYRLGNRLIAHLAGRKCFFDARAQAAGLLDDPVTVEQYEALSSPAFAIGRHWPLRFALGFAAAGLFTLGVFFYFVLVNDAPLRTLWPVILIGVASTTFYLLVLGFMLWFRRTMKRHDLYERLLTRWFDDSRVTPHTLPDDDYAGRWEHFDQHVALFVILGLPIIFSPAITAWYILYQTGIALGTLVAPVAVFAFAGVYHLWGARLLLKIWHSHLSAETRQVDNTGSG